MDSAPKVVSKDKKIPIQNLYDVADEAINTLTVKQETLTSEEKDAFIKNFVHEVLHELNTSPHEEDKRLSKLFVNYLNARLRKIARGPQPIATEDD